MPIPFKKTAVGFIGSLLIGSSVGTISYGGISAYLGRGGKAVAVEHWAVQRVTATGSTDWVNGRYAAGCLPLPLTDSGLLLEVGVHMKNAPDALGGDIYFTKDCNDNTQTGHTLVLESTTTESGGVTHLVFTGSAVANISSGPSWNKADFLKFTFHTNVAPNSDTAGWFYAKYMDNFGE